MAWPNPGPTLNQTFEECVLDGLPECLIGGNRTEMLISYFCGYDQGCDALQRAKLAVETRYSVVEKREESLEVMEAYLPLWFRNARYQDSILKLGKLGTLSNPHPKPSPLVVAELKVRLKLDFEFYEFVKQRLERQRKKIQKPIRYYQT